MKDMKEIKELDEIREIRGIEGWRSEEPSGVEEKAIHEEVGKVGKGNERLWEMSGLLMLLNTTLVQKAFYSAVNVMM